MNLGDFIGRMAYWGNAEWIHGRWWCEIARLHNTQPSTAIKHFSDNGKVKRGIRESSRSADHRHDVAVTMITYLNQISPGAVTFEEIVHATAISKSQSNRDILQELVDNRKVKQTCPGRWFRYTAMKTGNIDKEEGEPDDE